MNVIVVKIGEPIMTVYSVSKITFTDNNYVLTTADSDLSFSADSYHIVIT